MVVELVGVAFAGAGTPKNNFLSVLSCLYTQNIDIIPAPMCS